MERNLFFVFAFLVLLAFPYRPFFPLSPWYQRTEVNLPVGYAIPAAYRETDELLKQTEDFLQLKAHKRVSVTIARDWAHFRRLQPQFSGKAVGAVTIATSTVIYVMPKLDEMKFDHREFLLHELAHAVMNQNQSIPDALAILKVPWLAEGLCVLNGDQKAYFSREEFLAKARSTPLGPVFEPGGAANMRFAYRHGDTSSRI